MAFALPFDVDEVGTKTDSNFFNTTSGGFTKSRARRMNMGFIEVVVWLCTVVWGS